MYPPALAEALRADGIEAFTVVERGLGGRSDSDVLAAAAEDGYALLTENVADFARIAAERLTAGAHHAGVLIALSSRFSRRPTGSRRSPWRSERGSRRIWETASCICMVWGSPDEHPDSYGRGAGQMGHGDGVSLARSARRVTSGEWSWSDRSRNVGRQYGPSGQQATPRAFPRGPGEGCGQSRGGT